MRTNLSRAQSTAEALIDTLSRPYLIGDLTVTTSASIGVAGYPDSGLTPASLLRQADIAMYRAKTSGKHRCVMFDKSFETGSET
jgi:diguanylate cyclase (GGDEF)-like protein